jgi:shikimate kinase
MESAASPMSDRPIVLIGMMGAGKTTVGKSLAYRLQRRYYDNDSEIEAANGLSVADIFAQRGEDWFREAEAASIRTAVEFDDPVVLSVGGGAVMRPETHALVDERCEVVWLRAPIGLLIERVTKRHNTRPMISNGDPAENMRRLYAEREPVYEALADQVIDVVGKTPAAIAAEIVVGVSA